MIILFGVNGQPSGVINFPLDIFQPCQSSSSGDWQAYIFIKRLHIGGIVLLKWSSKAGHFNQDNPQTNLRNIVLIKVGTLP
ncbi:hypothetical protein VXS02_09260 [Photobacterium piscicola]|uniref:hypothetical protein n=1 Tax=Photobacterium piscicola TaxID=1378299 RepID=UPI002E1967EC|nr:hypothetical protein [Photobacterium piscicola]